MKYQTIDAALFKLNRKNFMSQMEDGTLAIFNSNDIFPISADSTMPFQQHRDILHLSGVDQEESILVLFPNSSNPKHKEVLFLKETSELIAIWEGEKLDKKNAFEVSGIQTVYWLQDFPVIFKQMMAESEGIYLNTNEHLRANTEVETREDRFIKKVKMDYPAHKVHKSAPIMHKIRSIKDPIEIELMQKACNITKSGVNRLLKFIKPGVWEHHIEAELVHEFLMNSSKGFAYTPIVASGKNACVLHYIENNKECLDGDVILLDVGAEYANYASDLTRTVPVNGRFSERQKNVYNAVHRVMKEATNMLRPGTDHKKMQQEVIKIMEEELINLGLFDKEDVKRQDPSKPMYKKYFMHGTSHSLGLDVHDVGDTSTPMQPGMVFTCEPGIYIREEGIGIRLENDVLVTSGDPDDLMKNIPIDYQEIESLMN